MDERMHSIQHSIDIFLNKEPEKFCEDDFKVHSHYNLLWWVFENRFKFLEKEKEKFERVERQIKEDTLKNDFDMVIVKYNNEYQKIKNQLNRNSIEERFLYYVSLINNHYGIINDEIFISDKNNSNKPKYSALNNTIKACSVS